MYYLVVSYFFVFQNIAVFPDAGFSPGLCRLSALFLVIKIMAVKKEEARGGKQALRIVSNCYIPGSAGGGTDASSLRSRQSNNR